MVSPTSLTLEDDRYLSGEHFPDEHESVISVLPVFPFHHQQGAMTNHVTRLVSWTNAEANRRCNDL